MELIEQIRAKCIEVNPEIRERWEVVTGPRGGKSFRTFDQTIRLADVLLAMPPGIYLKTLGEMTRMVAYDEEGEHKGIEWWNCSQDDLEKQSKETLAFIAKVLGITN